MSLTASEMTPSDIAAVVGNNGNGNNGFGWGGDGWWLILLFLFAFNGGWGGGFGGNGATPYIVNNDVQRGFDQSAIMGSLNGITSAVANGFANAELSRANANTNLLQSLWSMQMSQQQCCCDNKAGLADLKYVVATEACADRQAFNEGVREIIANQTAGIQTILDEMCAQKIETLRQQNENLRTQLNMATLNASQTAQTAVLLQDNARQTSILNPTPIPAYIVANPNTAPAA